MARKQDEGGASGRSARDPCRKETRTIRACCCSRAEQTAAATRGRRGSGPITVRMPKLSLVVKKPVLRLPTQYSKSRTEARRQSASEKKLTRWGILREAYF